MRLCVLGSGSKGHAVFVEAGETRLLFDAGFSAREMKRRLDAVGVDMDTITAVIISHEHTDHVAGLRVMGRKFPVYATAGTMGQISNRYQLNGKEKVRSGEWYDVGDLRFLPVPISHDAREPVGYVVEDGSARAAIVTDLGIVTRVVRDRLSDLTLALVESNHDPEMLLEGPYPWEIKDRVKGRHGHLSNPDTGGLLNSIAHTGLKHVLLGHLSETNNRPELARKEAQAALDGHAAKIHVCAQNKPGEMITIK